MYSNYVLQHNILQNYHNISRFFTIIWIFSLSFPGHRWHSSTPPPPTHPLLFKAGRTFQKIMEGGSKNFARKGRINLKRAVDVEMGGSHFITLQFNHIYSVCGKSKASFITFFPSVFWISHVRFSSKSL